MFSHNFQIYILSALMINKKKIIKESQKLYLIFKRKKLIRKL